MNNTYTLLCSTVLETNRFTSEHTSLGMSWILEASQTVPDLAIACNSLFYGLILCFYVHYLFFGIASRLGDAIKQKDKENKRY